MVATADRRPVPAAGVFTTNLVTAAPVQVSRRHLDDGHAAAVVLSSGNANAATGEGGRADALHMTALAGRALGCAQGDVLVCSTGLIGYRLPMPALEDGIPRLAGDLNGAAAAADAILTTDTRRKEATAAVGGTTGRVGGMAKGAAMLAPAMATMLAVLTTDVAAPPDLLQTARTTAVESTFNALCVDACTSTNDTVLVLANGAAGVTIDDRAGIHALTDALTDVSDSLAGQMADDAEGATKVATVTVRGARSADDARRAARAVASSQLVQCSLNGEDPYWGRVLSDLGASGARFDPEAVEIAYGGIACCRRGVAAAHDEAALAAVMARRAIDIECDLGAGRGTATMRFTDLSHAYVDENRGTS
jgi:glutamate N-acetyltransferase/amino-acid N-acetyltransferase